jgi:26S proteasome regulatory subunit N3
VLRGLASTRKRLNEDVIRRLILFYYGSNSSEREILLGFAQSVSQVYFFIIIKIEFILII